MFRIILLICFIGISKFALAVGSLADISVYDRTQNRTLPVHYHDGRYYIVGKPGNEYQINLRNNSGNDVMSVMSVDGVNVITGETASWDQSGYVIGSYNAAEIKGWRKSMKRVAAFYFTSLPNSYAARTGRPDNVGVIGVALFRKKYEPEVYIEPYPQPRPYSYNKDDYRARREAPAAADSMSKAAPAAPASGIASEADRSMQAAPEIMPKEKLGTGHGRNERSQARYTTFERASSTPDEVISIYYDSYENLVAMGVIKRVPPIATPFPGQFVPDPR
jgi:hypothetical protein